VKIPAAVMAAFFVVTISSHRLRFNSVHFLTGAGESMQQFNFFAV